MSKERRTLKGERLERYKIAQEMTERISRAIHRVLSGEPESSACRAENVDLTWLRRFIRTDISIGNGKAPEEVKVKVEDWYDWQDRFLFQLTEEEWYAPEDFDNIFEECLTEACTEIECMVIRMRYQEGMTLAAIGSKFGKTSERIRQIEAQAMRKLRRPSYRLVLMYGRDYKKQMKKVKTAQAAYDQARLECMDRSCEEMLTAVQSVKDKYEALVRDTQELRKAAESNPKEEDPLDKIKITDLGLSARAENALRLHRVVPKKGNIMAKPPIETVGQLAKVPLSELRMFRNLGENTIKEITDKLYSLYGIKLE